MTKLLDGVTVLDLSRILAAPWCTQLLADFGADVIKVERPGEGDDTRNWGPPYLEGTGGDRESAYFLCANRGKRAMAVDFTSEAGQGLIRALAAQADVLVENFKVGGLARYGLDYATLSAINPRLIYCSVTGFGQTGPYAPRAGYDFIVQGMGGLMSVTGPADDQPGGEPQRVGVAVADVMTGLYACNAILAALHKRAETGRGQHIDVALLDVQVAALANQSMNYLVTGEVPVRTGNAHPTIVPYQTFRASDGHMIIAVGNDGQFARLCKALGMPHAADPRFATNRARRANRAELADSLQAVLETRPAAHWVELLEGLAVPAGPINTIDRVFEDPQVKARGLLMEVPHPTLGSVPSVGQPVRFSDGPLEYGLGIPTMGQHTDDILRSRLSLSDAEIAELRRTGAVA
jgi:crotonobetainyl-CoA:carnitine CoA-transferase CaiB-like acyl-CoA transferase